VADGVLGLEVGLEAQRLVQLERLDVEAEIEKTEFTQVSSTFSHTR
jgi:hypothetical protein